MGEKKLASGFEVKIKSEEDSHPVDFICAVLTENVPEAVWSTKPLSDPGGSVIANAASGVSLTVVSPKELHVIPGQNKFFALDNLSDSCRKSAATSGAQAPKNKYAKQPQDPMATILSTISSDKAAQARHKLVSEANKIFTGLWDADELSFKHMGEKFFGTPLIATSGSSSEV
jgi:hypothetical protein